jgi:hypothetical protein
MYHKVGLTAFRLVNQVMKKETIVNGLSCCKSGFTAMLQPNSFLLLTIKHKLTLFRIKQWKCYTTFPNWRFDKGSEGRDMNYST